MLQLGLHVVRLVVLDFVSLPLRAALELELELEPEPELELEPGLELELAKELQPVASSSAVALFDLVFVHYLSSRYASKALFAPF